MSDKKELEKLTYTDLLPYNRTSFEPTEKFLKAIVDILLDHIKNSNDRDCKIVDFHHPKDLMEKFKFDVNENSQSLASLLDVCRESLHYQVKTGHPRFFNQISCGLDLISMAGEWLTATANTNMFTYEISPVFILMENEVLTKMRELIGWTDGDGIFCPGGAISNLYAIMAARHNRFPRSKALGASEIPPLAMFTSVDSHYSVKGAAGVCGIGTDYCFSIDVDSKGRMIPEELEAKIVECKNQGIMPFFVNCTMGTTVYGAFDPIQEIADICDRHHLWLHADAAWGGGLLMSNKHRHLLGGIERAHSVTWNPHKLLGVLLQCSAVLIKQEGLLFQCNQMSADYLFMQDKPYDVSYDTGDKVIQCGRHNDVFKFWLMWKAKGRAGFERQVNYLMDLRAYFVARIKETEGYTMVMEDIAPKIKAKMMSSGTTMVGYQPDKNYPNFFRMIISNPGITREDLDFLIDKIAEFGQDL